MQKAPVSLVIFDCDGVLVDSEGLSSRVLVEAVHELGLELSSAEILESFRGCKMADFIAALGEHLGRPLPEDFTASFRKRSAEAFRSGLQAIPGIHEALGRITMPVCVASNGPHEKMNLALSITGLLPRFEGRIFSAYDIGSWKPAPDLYLHAAAAYGAAPENCVVVEDSPVGVRAGVAARMRVLGYTAGLDPAPLAALGARPFARMEELPELL